MTATIPGVSVSGFSTPLLGMLLVIFFVLGAFFSVSETAFMSLNRFRLKHQVKQQDKRAMRIYALLNPPDKLLSLVLLGNTFASMAAASVSTFLILRFTEFKSVILICNILLAFAMFVLAEMLPKSLAAMYPDWMARKVVNPLWVLGKLAYPILRVTHAIHRMCLRALAIPRLGEVPSDVLDLEELKTLIYEGRLRLSKRNKAMLLQLLNLKNVQVEDVMVPRSEIVGINIASPWSEVVTQLIQTHHAYLPLYEGNIDDVRGVLRVRDLVPHMRAGQADEPLDLMVWAQPPYFIPEGTSLTKQLLQFQKNHLRMGFVVDEYGTLQGLITVEDIVEEIVGELGPELPPVATVEDPQLGTYRVEGGASLRWLNRHYGWNLPTSGPKTLNGLIVEYLEEIPSVPVGLVIQGYKMEILEVEDHVIQWVRIHIPAPSTGVRTGPELLKAHL